MEPVVVLQQDLAAYSYKPARVTVASLVASWRRDQRVMRVLDQRAQLLLAAVGAALVHVAPFG